MKLTARAIGRAAVCLAALAGCSQPTLPYPGTGGAVGQNPGAGKGGSAGRPSGGMGGTGGGSFHGDPPPCSSVCGNGRVDACLNGQGPGGTEACDGTDFGFAGDGCARHGYGSGQVKCSDSCTLDLSGCSECLAGVPSLLACGVVPSSGNISTSAIAATDSEVGVVTVAYGDDTGTALSFQRLTPDLAVAGNLTLVSTPPSGVVPGGPSVAGAAVAPLASGWLVATCMAGRAHLFAVDATGSTLSHALEVVRTDARFECAGVYWLLTRPGGGPLLIWQAPTASGWALAEVAADGRTIGAAHEIVAPDLRGSGVLHGAWVGDAFHLVTVFNPDPWRPEKQLRVMRADADGVSSHLDLLTGLLDQPRIVLGSADLRLTYHALDANASVVKLTRFGPAGQVLQDAVVPPTTVINSTPAVAMGEDTVVLLGAEKTLALTRLGPDGRMIGTPVQIVQGVSVGGVDVQRLGSDVVVSWFSYVSGRRRLGLARVAP